VIEQESGRAKGGCRAKWLESKSISEQENEKAKGMMRKRAREQERDRIL
jgi:hypothetical protein